MINGRGRWKHDFSRMALGCQRPHVQCLDFDDDDDILHRLQSNDRDTEGLALYEDAWVNGAGSAIGDSAYLRKIIIDLPGEEARWIDDFWHGLSQNRSIEWLALNMFGEVELHNDGILASFMKYNYNLRCLTFNDADSSTFDHLILLMSNCCNRRLECIEVSCYNGTDEQAAMFFNSLNRYLNLLELAFDGPTIGRIGCTALANLLTNPVSRVIKLRLEGNDFDDYSIIVLSNALIYRNTLISLSFSGREYWFEEDEPNRITTDGWRAFFSIFSRPTCSIEDLFLNLLPDCDEFEASLGDALASNQTLKYLHIGEEISFTLGGWKNFAACLRNPNSALTELNLLGCRIESRGIAEILTALAANTTLRRLTMKRAVIIENAEILSRLLCDRTSIDRTYLSNHSIHSIHWNARPGMKDLMPGVSVHLKMNKHENKFEVARCKILAHHFSGEFAATCILSRMPETVFPHALSWICIDGFGYSAMYSIVHALPSLFVSPNSARKKRKY